MIKLLTLCIIHENNRVLLGMKKRGFGAGKWNGFGGKVEQGERIEQAAVRELKEEAGIDVHKLEKRGILDFVFTNTPDSVLQVHVFKPTEYTGDPIETDEMKPQWFAIEHIPYADMWADDIYWFPLFFANKKFKGMFTFDENHKLLSNKLAEVNEL